MAKRNIFSTLANPSTNIGRNGFDLSHRKVFSAKAGELLPILCEDCVPGDYFEVDTATLIRTMPLNTAAFMRARACFDFFFVPKTKIWSRYNSFISQRDNLESSTLQGYQYEPNISFAELSACVANGSTTSAKDSQDARAKLLELLGYGNGCKSFPTGFDTTKSLTALPIAGYNAIYNSYYRNAWRDMPTTQDVMDSNLDFLQCTNYATSLLDSTSNPDFVRMHYHGWFKDLFMGSLPNQQFGVVSSVDASLPSNVILQNNASYNTGDTPSLSTANLLLKSNNGSIVSGSSLWKILDSYSYAAARANFDVLALRKALALQKWKEYNMRAGWKSKNQQEAMFGVKSPYDAQHNVDFIDSHEQVIQISEVLSTNGDSAGNLGEIAGKGISADGSRKIKYSVNQPGYLYCIFYIMPESEYDADMVDRQLVRSEPFDHYTPAFENLGMQAIHKHEVTMLGNPTNFNSVIGYAPNYYEYKTRVDKVYGTFRTGQSLSPWVSVRRDLATIVNSSTIPIDYFYVNPSILDSMFTVNADPTLDTDQFIVNCNIDCKAVRPMSVLGLPTL